MENNKSKKTLYIVLVIVLVAVLGFCVFMFSKNDEKNPNSDEPIVENTVINYSCYDYIMDEMAKPQMYDEKWIPQYDQAIYNEIAREKMPNGSGFKYDEETNTFYRGYLSVLRLDFENNKAYIEEIDDYDVLQEIDNRDSSYHRVMTIDFEKGEYQVEGSDQIHQLVHPETIKYEGQIYFSDFEYLPYTYWFEHDLVPKSSGNSTSLYGEEFLSYDELYYTYMSIPWHIEKIMYRYNAQFESVGAKLYGATKSDMEAYKNKEADLENEVIIKSDKLDGCWQLEDFDWAYENSDIEWIDDLNMIFDIELPRMEGWEYGNSPIYVYFMSEKGYSSQYYLDSGNHTFDSRTLYVNIGGALGAYFTEPALKTLYGFNATFFYPLERVAYPTMNDAPEGSVCPTVDMIKNYSKFNYGLNRTGGYAISYMPQNAEYGTSVIVSEYTYELTDGPYLDSWIFMQMNFNRLNKIEDFPFSDDYMFNFLCMYHKTYQECMGLR